MNQTPGGAHTTVRALNALIPEPPLLILPSLAKAIGLNGAVILQQIHYWLIRSDHENNGRMWIYNSYPNWKKQFPWWSISTIKRTINSLERQGLLISGKFNRLAVDRTKWYSIDYEKLGLLGLVDRPSAQLDPISGSERIEERRVSTSTIPETSTKTTASEKETKKPRRPGFGTSGVGQDPSALFSAEEWRSRGGRW